jgi:hypothetical protein
MLVCLFVCFVVMVTFDDEIVKTMMIDDVKDFRRVRASRLFLMMMMISEFASIFHGISWDKVNCKQVLQVVVS